MLPPGPISKMSPKFGVIKLYAAKVCGETGVTLNYKLNTLLLDRFWFLYIVVFKYTALFAVSVCDISVCVYSLQPLTQQASAWLLRGGGDLHTTPCSRENGSCLGTSLRLVTLRMEAE